MSPAFTYFNQRGRFIENRSNPFFQTVIFCLDYFTSLLAPSFHLAHRIASSTTRTFAFTLVYKRCRLTVITQGGEVLFGSLFSRFFVCAISCHKVGSSLHNLPAVDLRLSVCVPPRVTRHVKVNSFLSSDRRAVRGVQRIGESR